MSHRVAKPEHVRDLGPVAYQAIVERLQLLSDTAWRREDELKENRFSCFHHTQHIIHRFIEDNRDARSYYETLAWPIWRDLLVPVMDRVTAVYGFGERVYPKSMFARLAAGHVIDRHVDGAGSNLQTHKIHVPLQTNPLATFSVNDRSFHLQAGRAYEVNNIAPHAAANYGDRDRIHFIFEVYDARALS